THRGQRERPGPMPDEPTLERIRPRPRPDPVPVLARRRREPGVEPLRRPTHAFGNDLGREHRVDRRLELLEIDLVPHHERCHLPPSMYPGVRATGDGELRLATQDLTKRFGEDTLHGSLPSVPPPPTEPGSVVRERHPNDHARSMVHGRNGAPGGGRLGRRRARRKHKGAIRAKRDAQPEGTPDLSAPNGARQTERDPTPTPPARSEPSALRRPAAARA